MMKTEAAVLWELGGDWKIEEVELGDPVPGEVLVKLAASGICHTDDHVVMGDLEQPLPCIGGHEGAGVVEAIGEGVTDLEVGDHVVLAYIPSCGKCHACALGNQHLCERGAARRAGRSMADGTYRFHTKGQGLTTICMLGTFSRYTVVHETQVIKIRDDVPLVQAALVGCGVSAGWGAAVNTAQVKAGDIVAVMGGGGLGMSAVQGAVRAGARYVVLIDPSEFKRDEAKKFGATHVAAGIDEARELINEISWGKMANKALLTTDLARSEYIGQILSLLGKQGRAVVVAVAPAGQETAEINVADLTFYEKELKGALYGSMSPRATVPLLMDLYKDGLLQLDEMITRTYRLDQINDGFRDMKAALNVRGVVVYD